MLDYSLESALVEFLQTNPALAEVHLFTSHDDEEHALPAVTVTSKSEPLAGSSEVFRADVSLLIENEAHDHAPKEHAALVEKVRFQFANRFAAMTAINGQGQVHIYGYVFMPSTKDVDGMRFRTTLALKVGYGAVDTNP